MSESKHEGPKTAETVKSPEELGEESLAKVVGGVEEVDDYPWDKTFLRTRLDEDCRWSYYRDDNYAWRKCGNCERLQYNRKDDAYFCVDPSK